MLLHSFPEMSLLYALTMDLIIFLKSLVFFKRHGHRCTKGTQSGELHVTWHEHAQGTEDTMSLQLRVVLPSISAYQLSPT